MSRKCIKLSLAVVVLVLGLATDQPSTVSVGGKFVDILGGKGSWYPVVAEARQGDTLAVLDSSDPLGWLQVRYDAVQPGAQGYVFKDSLTAQNDAPVVANIGPPGSTEATAAAAARGWDVVQWSSDYQYTTAGLDSMKATQNRVASRVESFEASGHVGVGHAN